ncbi:MAG: hypothetical protein KKB50_09765 [Planctomycetes bacterium]|nr:hypothetical protein [Planctomycetota bacterium]
MNRSYRLSPCDCLFHAFDHHMRQQGYPGAATFILMDTVGPLDPQHVSQALARTMAAYPATTCKAAISFWRAWPLWRATGQAVRPHYTYEDLVDESDWPTVADQRCEEGFSRGWDPAKEAPQIRLEHYRGPRDQHRLCFRWPHALMDAEGLQHFVSEMNRLADDSPAPAPDHLLPDGAVANPLAECGLLRRMQYVVQGLRERAPLANVQRHSLCNSHPDRAAAARRLRYILRSWSPRQVAMIQDRAREVTPPGPALYSRYVAGCVLRAIYRLHAEHDRQLPYYGTMFPMRVQGLQRRPVLGNYLVAATLHVMPERITDKRALGEDIQRQLRAYAERRSDLASWALQRWTAQLRVGQYRRLIEGQTRRQPFATGYSLYGEIEPPLRQFLGTEITNLWGNGVLSIPPGWNPVFSRFKERLNFSLTWPEGAFPPAIVQRYADLIEEEAFEA